MENPSPKTSSPERTKRGIDVHWINPTKKIWSVSNQLRTTNKWKRKSDRRLRFCNQSFSNKIHPRKINSSSLWKIISTMWWETEMPPIVSSLIFWSNIRPILTKLILNRPQSNFRKRYKNWKKSRQFWKKESKFKTGNWTKTLKKSSSTIRWCKFTNSHNSS